jgi:hypothetical protein
MGWVEASEGKKKIEPHGCSVGLNLQAKPVFRHWVRCGRGETRTYLLPFALTLGPLRSILGVRPSNHQSLVGATARGVITLIS